jgi:hypothetical protein
MKESVVYSKMSQLSIGWRAELVVIQIAFVYTEKIEPYVGI